MIPTKNQPVIFNEDQSCFYEYSYEQRVNQGDITQFQFKMEVCSGSPNLVTNGNFNNALTGWTQVGTGWSLGSGSTAVKSGTTTAILRQNILSIGTYYKVVVDIEAINTDESSNIAEVRIGSGTRFFPLALGRNELWGRALGTGNLELRCNNNSQLTVNFVEAYVVDTNYVITICDESGTILLPIYFNSATAPYYNTTYFDLDRQFITVNIDWNTLSVGPGCYTIGMLDPCTNEFYTNICNFDFAQGSYCWNKLGEFIPNARIVFAISPGGNGSVTFLFNFFATSMYLYSDDTLENGIAYNIEYNVSSTTGTPIVTVGNGIVGPSSVTFDQTLPSHSSAGTFSGTITTTQNNTVIAIYVIDIGGTGSVVFDYISVKRADITTATNDFTSSKFDLKTSHPCTKVLKISNDQDAFGFSFKDFAPRLRVKADLRAGADRSEREFTRNSSGIKKVYFADVMFSEDLVLEPVPDYLHRFLRYMSKVGYLYIDGVSYFVMDDEYPDVTWNKQRNLGGVTLEVSENTLQLNQNCDGFTGGGASGSTGVGSGGGDPQSGGTGVGFILVNGDGAVISLKD